MNRKELIKNYYNDYALKLLKNYVSKLSKNKESIREFSEVDYRKTKENFLIIFEIVDDHDLNSFDIYYQIIDMITHESLSTLIRAYSNNSRNLEIIYDEFEDEELNQMLKSFET